MYLRTSISDPAKIALLVDEEYSVEEGSWYMRSSRTTASFAEYILEPFIVKWKTGETGACRSTCSWDGGSLIDVETVAVTRSSDAEAVRRNVSIKRTESVMWMRSGDNIVLID